jgi:hypothetical protein
MVAKPTHRSGGSSSGLRPYLRLLRPPNLVTAAADILAGAAAAGLATDLSLVARLPLLVAASVCLYGGGVVLNDVFDAGLDAVERPERPIPSGQVPRARAAWLGGALLALGVLLALAASALSGALAAVLAACVLCYDGWAKHHASLGPLAMGSCRALNLLLGLSSIPGALQARWYLALIPLTYIVAITTLSRGEVHGGRRAVVALALGLLAMVVSGLLLLPLLADFALLHALPLLLLFCLRLLPPWWRAYRDPAPANLRHAVKTGVLSLILLDSIVAAGFAGLLYGLGVLALLMVAAMLARLFMVT